MLTQNERSHLCVRRGQFAKRYTRMRYQVQSRHNNNPFESSSRTMRLGGGKEADKIKDKTKACIPRSRRSEEERAPRNTNNPGCAPPAEEATEEDFESDEEDEEEEEEETAEAAEGGGGGRVPNTNARMFGL